MSDTSLRMQKLMEMGYRCLHFSQADNGKFCVEIHKLPEAMHTFIANTIEELVRLAYEAITKEKESDS